MKISQRRSKRFAAAAALALAALSARAPAAQAAGRITVTGSWSQTINSSNLTGGAGTDLTSAYTSAGNQVLLSISNTVGTHNWNVTVRRVDAVWNSNLNLYVQRTSDGTASAGNVSGGTSYQLVTTSDQLFFTGHNNANNFAVQIQLNGVSLQVPPASYTTTLTFTEVDI